MFLLTHIYYSITYQDLKKMLAIQKISIIIFTMKRVLLLIVLSLAVNFSINNTAEAGFLADKKAAIQQAKIDKTYHKEIQTLMDKQAQYAANYNLEGLKSLYSDKFIDNDGYNKEVYFKLVKDTWETYPDITYNVKIKQIELNGDYATVLTEETSFGSTNDSELINISGELYSKGKCRYHLERHNNKWVITAEEVQEEVTTLKYGEARYINMNLSSPRIVGAGQLYTSTLSVDLPAEEIVIASINKEKIITPSEKPEDKYRRLPDEQILSRMFTSNTDNVNEYNIAVVGITKSERVDKEKVKVYMDGLAIIMTRVNVVPKNNFANIGDDDEL